MKGRVFVRTETPNPNIVAAPRGEFDGSTNGCGLSVTVFATGGVIDDGWSVILANSPLQMGMAGALETQCGQSFGTEQFHKLGNYVFCAILFLILSSAPISILWIFMDKLLVLLGQDHAISLVAGNYCIWLIPTLFGYSRFVFELGLGQNEAALSIGISYWLSVMLLIVYTVLSVMSEN
ncbi:hypothetical protein JHK82_045118 [Glycine max]|nr:hypothetical protein JHK82_045118 [Glycine max]